MKIKEAAGYCGLTEKAIRLYEAKGLIHPVLEEKNGRTFREYAPDTIRDLLTVATLRRAGFPLEQIGILKTDPARIPEIFALYREEIRENAERLHALHLALESVPPDETMELDVFAARLACAMTDHLPVLPGQESDEWAAPSAVIHFRNTVWDEDLSPEEKEQAFLRFRKRQETREKRENLLFALPRKLKEWFARLSGIWSPRLRDENHRLRTGVKIIALLLAVLLFASAGLFAYHRKIQNVRDQYTAQIFLCLHDTVYALRETSFTGDYTYRQSETICQNLHTLDTLHRLAEELYFTAWNRRFERIYDLQDLTNAMGCRYRASHNGESVASLLYDRVLSENELTFLEALTADLEEVYAHLLGPDELNRREDLHYEAFREVLNRFFETWSEWSWNSPAPYSLLTTTEES